MTHQETASNELVSVVIPMYNVASTLEECLESVCGQTHRNLQIICVNDGSPDNSLAIAQRFAATDTRVEVLDRKNGGYGSACNAGIAASRGTWIAIVEPDDYLEPTCYEELLKHVIRTEMQSPSCVDVVRCGFWRVLARAEREVRVPCAYMHRVRPRRQPFSLGEATELIRHHPAIWAGVYRRDFLLHRGVRFVEAPGAGWTDNPFMGATLCGNARLAYLDRPLYNYREHSANEAQTFSDKNPQVPLARMQELIAAAKAVGEKDDRVWRALALRAVNYALLVAPHAADDPIVAEQLSSCLGNFSPELIEAEQALSPAGRALYYRVTQQREAPRGHAGSYLSYVVRELLWRARLEGPLEVLRTIRARRS